MTVDCFILLSDVQEVHSNVPYLIIILAVLVFPLIFVLIKKRKLTPSKVKINFVGERKFRPRLFNLTFENKGKSEIDLNAPILIFKRWRTERRFRIKPSNKTDIYPILLEPDKNYTLNINLEDFYEADADLKKAGRIRVETTDVRGKKFTSHFVRLKWL
jgi:hypothetical protein